MSSQTRIECGYAIGSFSAIVNANVPNGSSLLYVGVAGDPPGGEYTNLFPNCLPKTFDIDAKWGPDIVGDITSTEFKDNSWDVIVCVQVLEHIKDLWKLPKEIHRILKPKGYAIIDCPWQYPYHAEPPSFKDYWRLSKDGMEELFGNDLGIVQTISMTHNTSCLLRKL